MTLTLAVSTHSGFVLAQSGLPSSTMLAARGDIVSSDEQMHALVLNVDQTSGEIVGVMSSGARCAGIFNILAEDGSAGQVAFRCSDGREGEGTYILEQTGLVPELSGYGCARLSKPDINDNWTLRFVFGQLAFQPGFPAGFNCSGGDQ